VAAGTPEEVCTVPESYTGQFLRKYLEDERNYTNRVPEQVRNLARLAESTNLE
jgi:hypothetical protein